MLVTLFLAIPVSTAVAAPLESDGQTPGDERERLLAETICDASSSFCRCSDGESRSRPAIVQTIAGQFTDPAADELAAHVDHCDRTATALFRRPSEDESDGDALEPAWSLVALHEDVHTRTCRRIDFESTTDRLVCHQRVEAETWRIGFFHALAFSPDGVEQRQLTHYSSNARGCPTDLLRTEHPLGWQIWHRPDDPRSTLVTVFLEHQNGRIPNEFDNACEAMKHGKPVFGPRTRVNEYFEWRGDAFAFAGATRRRAPETEATWTTSERPKGPMCRRRDAVEHIRSRRDGLHRCYAESLDDGETPTGTLKLKWTIGSDGSVERTEIVDDGLDHEQLTECVRELVAEISFPAPRGGDQCSFVYPFQFGPKEKN